MKTSNIISRRNFSNWGNIVEKHKLNNNIAQLRTNFTITYTFSVQQQL